MGSIRCESQGIRGCVATRRQRYSPNPTRGRTASSSKYGRANGNLYDLIEEHVAASPYNTLVEFVYRISIGDLVAAQSLVNNPSLVQQGINLGLVQDPPGQLWEGWCGDGTPAAEPPCSIMKRDDGTFTDRFTIEMIPAREGWMISKIERAP